MQIEIPDISGRALGAIAIALAGVLFGFTTGRLSAWLVPPSGLTVAASGATSKPTIPLEPAASARTEPKRPPMDATGANVQSKLPTEPKEASTPRADPKLQSDAADTGKPMSAGVASRALSPGSAPADNAAPSDRDVTILNPDAQRQEPPIQSRTPARYSAGEGDDLRTLAASPEGLELCRRKYRSFDPADGTYKPYGQDTRVRCPHLR